jgi:hypothetical protein
MGQHHQQAIDAAQGRARGAVVRRGARCSDPGGNGPVVVDHDQHASAGRVGHRREPGCADRGRREGGCRTGGRGAAAG